MKRHLYDIEITDILDEELDSYGSQHFSLCRAVERALEKRWSADTALLRQVLDDICAVKLCEFNSMSSRDEMIRLLDKVITALRERLGEEEK